MSPRYIRDVRRTRRFVAILVAAMIFGVGDADAKRSDRVKLVVMVIVDQLGSNYMTAYERYLDRGIGALIKRGAYYENAVHATANAATGPGHATIVTGAWPNVHGVISNVWFDPRDGQEVYCVGDPRCGVSPHRLMVPSLGDAMRLATRGQSRTVALAVKDRVAVLCGGERPLAAVWYDNTTGGFTSGTWWGPTNKPTWLDRTNRERNAHLAFGEVWDRVEPKLDYTKIVGPDDLPYEATLDGLTTTLPMKYGTGIEGPTASWLSSYRGTPYALDTLFALTRAAFDEEKLGQGEAVDLLVIGVSPLDFAGHWYGPQSHEVFDHLLRTDRAIGDLMRHVDKTLGRDSVLWIVTGDHGVVMTPEVAVERGVRAKRVGVKAMVAAVDDALAPLAKKGKLPTKVRVIDPPFVFLTHDDPDVDRTEARRIAARALAGLPEVVEAHAVNDLDRMPEPFRIMYERVSYPGRTPDVFIRTRPQDLVDPNGYTTGSGHGTPYTYDTNVPLIVAGPGVRRGRDPRPYPITRLVPTITTLTGIDPPAAAHEAPLPAALP